MWMLTVSYAGRVVLSARLVVLPPPGEVQKVGRSAHTTTTTYVLVPTGAPPLRRGATALPVTDDTGNNTPPFPAGGAIGFCVSTVPSTVHTRLEVLCKPPGICPGKARGYTSTVTDARGRLLIQNACLEVRGGGGEWTVKTSPGGGGGGEWTVRVHDMRKVWIIPPRLVSRAAQLLPRLGAEAWCAVGEGMTNLLRTGEAVLVVSDKHVRPTRLHTEAVAHGCYFVTPEYMEAAAASHHQLEPADFWPGAGVPPGPRAALFAGTAFLFLERPVLGELAGVVEACGGWALDFSWLGSATTVAQALALLDKTPRHRLVIRHRSTTCTLVWGTRYHTLAIVTRAGNGAQWAQCVRRAIPRHMRLVGAREIPLAILARSTQVLANPHASPDEAASKLQTDAWGDSVFADEPSSRAPETGPAGPEMMDPEMMDPDPPRFFEPPATTTHPRLPARCRELVVLRLPGCTTVRVMRGK